MTPTLNKSHFNTFIFHLGTAYLFAIFCMVCSHIVGVHLSIDQVTYYFMMDADLYKSFLLRLLIKSF